MMSKTIHTSQHAPARQFQLIVQMQQVSTENKNPPIQSLRNPSRGKTLGYAQIRFRSRDVFQGSRTFEVFEAHQMIDDRAVLTRTLHLSMIHTNRILITPEMLKGVTSEGQCEIGATLMGPEKKPL